LTVALALTVAVSTALILWPGRGGTDGLPKTDLGVPATPTAVPSYIVPDKTDPIPPGVTSPPVRIAIPALGVDTGVVGYTAEMAQQAVDSVGQPCFIDGVIRCINPPRGDLVYQQLGGRYGVDYGSDPGLESNGTVYLLGHAGWPGGSVFDNLRDLQPGDTADVWTDYGIITYEVQEVFTILKTDFVSSESIRNQVPGRLLLISCDQSGPLYWTGQGMYNVVASLQAVSARERD
jgi:LPXTG-site transpeptidase (sortase) family protein